MNSAGRNEPVFHLTRRRRFFGLWETGFWGTDSWVLARGGDEQLTEALVLCEVAKLFH